MAYLMAYVFLFTLMVLHGIDVAVAMTSALLLLFIVWPVVFLLDCLREFIRQIKDIH